MTKSTPLKQDPPGYKPRVFQHYRGLTIYKTTDIFMHSNMIMASPMDFYAVRLPDGTWLYSEDDNPNNLLMFGKPRFAREAIDQYLAGQRKFEESQW
jgi:hypothetical protein